MPPISSVHLPPLAAYVLDEVVIEPPLLLVPEVPIAPSSLAIPDKLLVTGALQHIHAEDASLRLRQWLGLARASDKVNSKLAQLSSDIRGQYRLCVYRMEVLLRDYFPQATIPQHQEFKNLLDRLNYIREELTRPGRFPEVWNLEVELKRVRILYNSMRDLALEILDKEPLAQEPDEPSPAPKPTPEPRETSTKKARDRFDVGGTIPALTNKTYSSLYDLELRPHQWEVIQKIKKEIQLSENNPEFALDDMVVGLPTGSGKTHIMSASIALGLRMGWFDLQRGDKIVITTHRTEIKKQILDEIIKSLNPVFNQLYGRDIRVSAYAGRSKDVSGDVVVVSIPSVKEENDPFYQSFHDSLGDSGQVPLLMMDEVHHDEARTWQFFKSRMRFLADSRGNQLRVLGFTATPTHKQKERLVAELGIQEAMQKGIIPQVNIVRVSTGLKLEKLKDVGVTNAGDFSTQQLSRVVNTSQRNRRMMVILREYGLRTEGNKGFQTTLGFAVEIDHALALANEHLRYFGKTDSRVQEEYGRQLARLQRKTWLSIEERELAAKMALLQGRFFNLSEAEARELAPLFLRNLVMVSDNVGLTEFQRILAQKENGAIDGIVMVVSGSTSSNVMKELEKAASLGLIEAVYNCQKLEEGYDAYWARNLLGGRPSLSKTRRAQEAGRIFRYGKDEVSKEGRLLKSEERRLIDVWDSAPGVNLVEYREVLGMPHTTTEDGVVYNLATQKPASDLEEKKEKIKRDNKINRDKETLLNGTEESRVGLYEVKLLLRQILGARYLGNVARMADDVGMEREEFEHWMDQDEIWLSPQKIRELEMLLYVDEGQLQITDVISDKSQEVVLQEANQVLLDSLLFYLGVTEKPWEAQTLDYRAGLLNDKYELKSTSLEMLRGLSAGDIMIRNLGVALYYEFGRLEKESVANTNIKLIQRHRANLVEGLNAYTVGVSKMGEKELMRVSGQMSWDKTVQGIVEQAGRLSEEKKKSYLKDYYFASHPGEMFLPEELIVTAGVEGVKANKIAVALEVLSRKEYEEKKRDDKQDKTSERYPRIVVSLDSDGQMFELLGQDKQYLFGPGRYEILRSLVKAGIIKESPMTDAIELEGLTGAKRNEAGAVTILKEKERIKELMLKIARDKKGEEWVITAGKRGALEDDKISVGLEVLSREEHDRKINGKVRTVYPFLLVHITSDDLFELRSPDEAFFYGEGRYEILRTLVAAGIVKRTLITDALELKGLTRGKSVNEFDAKLDGQAGVIQKIKVLMSHVAQAKLGREFVIAAGTGGTKNGKISVGLEVLTREEFKRSKDYHNPHLLVHLDGGQFELQEDADSFSGQGRYEILKALVEAGIIKKTPLTDQLLYPQIKGTGSSASSALLLGVLFLAGIHMPAQAREFEPEIIEQQSIARAEVVVARVTPVVKASPVVVEEDNVLTTVVSPVKDDVVWAESVQLNLAEESIVAIDEPRVDDTTWIPATAGMTESSSWTVPQVWGVSSILSPITSINSVMGSFAFAGVK